MIVVDASVVIKWSVIEPGHEEARALIRSLAPLASPSIVIPEVANVLRKKVKRNQIEWHHAELAIATLSQTIGRILDISSWSQRILTLSRRLDHAPYDCCYLICAEDLQAPLLTEDLVLAGKARSVGLSAATLSDWRTAL